MKMNSNPTTRTIDEYNIKAVFDVVEDHQDQAMVLIQQIVVALEPKKPGGESVSFSAWRMAQILQNILESGDLQSSVKHWLGGEVQK